MKLYLAQLVVLIFFFLDDGLDQNILINSIISLFASIKGNCGLLNWFSRSNVEKRDVGSPSSGSGRRHAPCKNYPRNSSRNAKKYLPLGEGGGVVSNYFLVEI